MPLVAICKHCGKEMYYSPYYGRWNCMRCTVKESGSRMDDDNEVDY